MKSPYFSVVIPTYNRDYIVPNAINSVLNQTFEDYEIIIVDDGSQDDTENVVRAFRSDRIRYFKTENSGAGQARNHGISRSTGNWIAFLDSDDIWLPTKLEETHEIIEQSDDVDFIFTRIMYDKQYEKSGETKYYLASKMQEKGFLLSSHLAFIPTVALKRSLIETWSITFPNTATAEDSNFLWKSILVAKKIHFIDKTLTLYSESHNNLVTLNKFDKQSNDIIQAIKDVTVWAKEQNIQTPEITTLQQHQYYTARNMIAFFLMNTKLKLLSKNIWTLHKHFDVRSSIRLLAGALKLLLSKEQRNWLKAYTGNTRFTSIS